MNNMLNKKIKHNRLKPKNKKLPKYLSYLHTQDLACFICGERNEIELHHIKEASSDEKDDSKVIPLCGNECHRLGLIISAHGTPKLFREKYPIAVQIEFADKLYLEYQKTTGE